MTSKILRHLPKAMSKLHKSIIPVKASGSWIYTKDKKYLDMTSGIGALSTGHNHPHVISEVKKQLDDYVHMSQLIYGSHPAQIELTEKLLSIVDPSLDTVFYTNCGSESTDNSIKIARRYTGKTNIISVMGGFHGRSLGAMALNSSGLSSKMMTQPLMPGVFTIEPTIDALNKALTLQTHPDETAAIILEPIQGEYGVFPIPTDFMRDVRQVCNKHNIMLIMDEVQCGFGRTGTWWCYELFKVVPDILNFGKGIGSGFQMAGIIANSDIMDCGKGYLGGTYGGNAISSKAASATIDVIKNEKLLERVRKTGSYINTQLQNHEGINQIRQYGLMIAIDINYYKFTKFIQSEQQCSITEMNHYFVNLLREKNVLVLTAGPQSQYIRILPSYNISREDTDIFINTLEGQLDLHLDETYFQMEAETE